MKYVKISEVDMARSRELVRNYVEGQVMVYCRQNSALPILRLEYTGSVYEGLKTEAADEVDVMVVLKTIGRKSRLKTRHTRLCANQGCHGLKISHVCKP